MRAPRPAPGTRWLVVLIGLALAQIAASAAAAQPVQVPNGYRMSEYRAPVPPSVPGATTVDTGKVRALVTEGNTVLIDVLPRPPRPAGLSEESVWVPKPRLSLPGAVWLPNVGFGALSDEMHRYFSSHLERLTTEMPAARLVFYCEPNCWMSWNAAKRAAEWGYERVYWYPQGTEGWLAAGHSLEAVEPAPSVK